MKRSILRTFWNLVPLTVLFVAITGCNRMEPFDVNSDKNRSNIDQTMYKTFTFVDTTVDEALALIEMV